MYEQQEKKWRHTLEARPGERTRAYRSRCVQPASGLIYLSESHFPVALLSPHTYSSLYFILCGINR